jgi:hypothetical protein
MTSADEYRIQAAALAAQLSKLYLRLAEQADKNSRLDVTYEPPFWTASPAP